LVDPFTFHRVSTSACLILAAAPATVAAMNSFSINALAKTLPAVCRQFQPRIASLSAIRRFSSSPKDSSSLKEKTRTIENQILDRQPESAENSSPLSAISKMMSGGRSSSSSRVSADYARLAESLEADMIKNPYADRAPPHHLHVYAHKHNTILTLTRPNGNPILSMGTGQIGFRKGGRAGFDPAYQLSSHVLSQIQERGLLMDIKRLEIVFQGFGKGRDGFTKVLLGNEGRNIRGLVSRVTDSTRIKFGGTRSRKVRRLG
jgi:small subunit ribosomal protein S11